MKTYVATLSLTVEIDARDVIDAENLVREVEHRLQTGPNPVYGVNVTHVEHGEVTPA